MSHLRSQVGSPITHRRAGDRAQRSEPTLLRAVVITNLCVPPVIGILISRTVLRNRSPLALTDRAPKPHLDSHAGLTPQ